MQNFNQVLIIVLCLRVYVGRSLFL